VLQSRRTPSRSWRRVEGRDLRRHHARHRAVGHLEHGDVEAEVARAGGRLEPDVAAADHDHLARAGDIGANGVHVGDRAQAVDAGEVVARHLEAPRRAADAQQQLVVIELAAVAEPQSPLGAAVDRGHAHPEAGVDAMLLVVLRAAQPQPLALQFAGQVFLGQRRAVVRQVRLVAHQHDGPGVTLAAQGIHRLHCSVPRPTMTTVCAITMLFIYVADCSRKPSRRGWGWRAVWHDAAITPPAQAQCPH
jgi:hypothetical protein